METDNAGVLLASLIVAGVLVEEGISAVHGRSILVGGELQNEGPASLNLDLESIPKVFEVSCYLARMHPHGLGLKLLDVLLDLLEDVGWFEVLW